MEGHSCCFQGSSQPIKGLTSFQMTGEVKLMKTNALDLAHGSGHGSYEVERGMFLRFFVVAASLNRTGVSALRSAI